MNARVIWTLWNVGKANTAEIARELKMKECEVDSVIARFINERYLEREKPFGKVRT